MATSTAGTIGNDSLANNRSGFSAYPAGWSYCAGPPFANIGTDCYWWSANAIDTSETHCHVLGYDIVDLQRSIAGKCMGFSVRLVKD